jgi:hypothetical protein
MLNLFKKKFQSETLWLPKKCQVRVLHASLYQGPFDDRLFFFVAVTKVCHSIFRERFLRLGCWNTSVKLHAVKNLIVSPTATFFFFVENKNWKKHFCSLWKIWKKKTTFFSLINHGSFFGKNFSVSKKRGLCVASFVIFLFFNQILKSKKDFELHRNWRRNPGVKKKNVFFFLFDMLCLLSCFLLQRKITNSFFYTYTFFVSVLFCIEKFSIERKRKLLFYRLHLLFSFFVSCQNVPSSSIVFHHFFFEISKLFKKSTKLSLNRLTLKLFFVSKNWQNLKVYLSICFCVSFINFYYF